MSCTSPELQVFVFARSALQGTLNQNIEPDTPIRGENPWLEPLSVLRIFAG
jgi:hypothetical protein